MEWEFILVVYFVRLAMGILARVIPSVYILALEFNERYHDFELSLLIV